MVEYCVYWLENGEPMHEVFSSLAAAEMYSCAIRGKACVYIARSVLVGHFLLFSLCSKDFKITFVAWN